MRIPKIISTTSTLSKGTVDTHSSTQRERKQGLKMFPYPAGVTKRWYNYWRWQDKKLQNPDENIDLCVYIRKPALVFHVHLIPAFPFQTGTVSLLFSLCVLFCWSLCQIILLQRCHNRRLVVYTYITSRREKSPHGKKIQTDTGNKLDRSFARSRFTQNNRVRELSSWRPKIYLFIFLQLVSLLHFPASSPGHDLRLKFNCP
jgi:hypothetical protein